MRAEVLILPLLLSLAAGLGAADKPRPGGDVVTVLLLEDPALQRLGERLFMDARLSRPEGQSCAACHDSASGWSGADHEKNLASGIYPGAVPERFGNRRPTTAAYSTYSPLLHAKREDGELLFVGGVFWDGRATGHLLGNPAADQAQGPFLNPVEHNLPEAGTVVNSVESGPYAELFRQAWKTHGVEAPPGEVTRRKFGLIALALAAFQHSPAVSPFTSKYDAYLRGQVRLSPVERRGLALFEGKGKCADCHPNRKGPGGTLPLFTDFTYDNLGFPANPENPWYRMGPGLNPAGVAWVDPGLAATLESLPQYARMAPANLGKHRVPTLRNVDKRPHPGFVKAYGHNGYFKSLEAVIHFYNTRDVLPRPEAVARPIPGVNCWPRPEVEVNLNREEMGDLRLSPRDEADLTAFLRTLSDGYQPPRSRPVPRAPGVADRSARPQVSSRMGSGFNP
ncbi:MAG: cytochrome C [Holophagaceae bacterium]|uniref:Cytochrome C n=1 Tax=Candidatus Geothrix skivensis TaxID=2954439 RepID=A0A9D7SK43_9BACT|nr:cytochrome C [Candidatus Geothrix skivensis]